MSRCETSAAIPRKDATTIKNSPTRSSPHSHGGRWGKGARAARESPAKRLDRADPCGGDRLCEIGFSCLIRPFSLGLTPFVLRNRLRNILKWFHNLYYANHICGTKGSNIDDARGPASGLQEHDSAGALAPKEAAVVSSMVMPSPLSFRIGRAGRRSSHPLRWEGEAARMGS